MTLPTPRVRYLLCAGGRGNRQWLQFGHIPRAAKRAIEDPIHPGQTVEVIHALERPEFVYCARDPERLLGLGPQRPGTIIRLRWSVEDVFEHPTLEAWELSQ